MELIDREALGIGKANRDVFEIPEYADGWNSAIDFIRNAQVVDAVPVVHAHWIYYNGNGWRVCSHCKDKRRTFVLDDFCPRCGARMGAE